MARILRENGLSISLFAISLLCIAGQYVTGWNSYNSDQQLHGQSTVSFTEYSGEGHFIEAIFENWESEFLQMAAYVVLTVFLYQKGSGESKKLDAVEQVDVIPEQARHDPNAPWPVRKGGLILKLYENSLGLALFALFVVSFVLHAVGGVKEYNQEQFEHGAAEQALSALEYTGTSHFWFESFQNWQSEFLSIGVMVVLSIFLRQKGSPNSKPVDRPHSETGD